MNYLHWFPLSMRWESFILGLFFTQNEFVQTHRVDGQRFERESVPGQISNNRCGSHRRFGRIQIWNCRSINCRCDWPNQQQCQDNFKGLDNGTRITRGYCYKGVWKRNAFPFAKVMTGRVAWWKYLKLWRYKTFEIVWELRAILWDKRKIHKNTDFSSV